MSQQVRVSSSICSFYPTTRETQELSYPSKLGLHFGPYQTANEKPEGLVAIISWQSWRRFHEIPFGEWSQYTHGHATDLVEDFFFYHVRYIPSVISSYLVLYPAQLQRYQLASDVRIKFSSLLLSLSNILDRC